MSPLHLVALHGYPLDRRMWGPLAAVASRGGMGNVTGVVAPDLRGRGTSKRPAGDIHAMSLLADDVAEELGALVPDGEPFLLAGLSMGGYVAFELVRRHGARLRGRLKGLVLLDTRATAETEAGRAKRREAIEAILAGGLAAALPALLPKLLAPRSRGSAAEALVKEMILATPPATACADLAGLAVRSEGFDVLGAFDRPVLILCGEDDALTPVADSEAMAAACANAPLVKLVTVPDAGHMAPLEKPEEVASAISELSKRV